MDRSRRRLLRGPAVVLAGLVIAATGPARPVGAAQRSPLMDGGPGSGTTESAVRPTTAVVPVASAFNAARVRLDLTLVKNGLVDPVLVTGAGDGSGRLFVVEQAGRIRVIAGGAILATPFLDLRGAIRSGGEQGLLGLAFHPAFPTRPYVYVTFTDVNGNIAVNRYTVGSDPNVAVRSSGLRLMTVPHPYDNHNGGNLAFGPDGYLYIGMGDGGSAGDPGNRAQSLNSMLGKMLRIDVNHTQAGKRYRVPASNPYVGRTGLDEIWSSGLRNPWRWSFDRKTGLLWIGDVGQGRYEEIDRAIPQGSVPAGRALNFGWRVLEGRACYRPSSGCSASGKFGPLIAYGHAGTGTDNCAVTGGFVYRGTANPVLYGGYVYGDFCSGRIWVVDSGAHTPATATLVRTDVVSPHLTISSFGEDDDGELYVCDLNGGAIYRISVTAKP